MRGLQDLLHLGSGVGEHLRIGVGGRAGGIAEMSEQVGGSPEQLHAGLGHLLRDRLDHRLEIPGRFGERAGLGSDVPIVETEVRQAELGEELEGGIKLGAAAVIGSAAPSSHGRSKVPAPKTSLPGQLNECQ